MNTRPFLFALSLAASVTLAADLPSIPQSPIGKKKEMLFQDDFSSPNPAKEWHKVVPTFTFENGALKGTQTRDKNIPAADGKPAVTPHAAVHGLDVPTKDSIVEVRFKLGSAAFVSVEFDDRAFKGSHYGHICYARVNPKTVSIVDQKEGSMRNDIYEMTDPAKKAERNKLLEGPSANFPVQFDPNEWHTLVVETVGDAMRASIDGKAVGYLKSPGIGHPTKSKIELGCGGKDGYFDDIKVWNAEPAK
jgi:hypothetical protein